RNRSSRGTAQTPTHATTASHTFGISAPAPALASVPAPVSLLRYNAAFLKHKSSPEVEPLLQLIDPGLEGRDGLISAGEVSLQRRDAMLVLLEEGMLPPPAATGPGVPIGPPAAGPHHGHHHAKEDPE